VTVLWTYLDHVGKPPDPARRSALAGRDEVI